MIRVKLFEEFINENDLELNEFLENSIDQDINESVKQAVGWALFPNVSAMNKSIKLQKQINLTYLKYQNETDVDKKEVLLNKLDDLRQQNLGIAEFKDKYDKKYAKKLEQVLSKMSSEDKETYDELVKAGDKELQKLKDELAAEKAKLKKIKKK